MNSIKQSGTNSNNRFDANKKVASRKNDSDSRKASQEQKALDASKENQKAQLLKGEALPKFGTQKRVQSE